MAVASGMGDSSVAAATYTILLPVATPTFSPPAGTYAGSAAVTISVTTSGATIRYTTDGSTPTAASAVYTSPIPVTQTTTIRAMASASGMADSAVASAAYTILQQVATPAFSPPGGTYVGVATVTMSVATSGATIRYTTDGSTPTATSPAYTGPLSITQTTHHQGDRDGERDGRQQCRQRHLYDPGGHAHVQRAGRDLQSTADRDGHHHDRRRGDLLHDRRDHADDGVHAIHRPDRGAADDDRSGRWPWRPEWRTAPSRASRIPSRRPRRPSTRPAAAYLLPQFVTISDASPNMTIYYTTDGSTPTTSSAQYTGSAIFVGFGTTTIRAIAVAPGWSQSAVASATYRIGL